MIPDETLQAGFSAEDLEAWANNIGLFSSRDQNDTGHAAHAAFKGLVKIILGKIPGLRNQRFDTHFQDFCGDAMEAFIKVALVFKMLRIACTRLNTTKEGGFVKLFMELYAIAFKRVCKDRDSFAEIDEVNVAAESSDEDFATARLRQRKNRARNNGGSSSRGRRRDVGGASSSQHSTTTSRMDHHRTSLSETSSIAATQAPEIQHDVTNEASSSRSRRNKRQRREQPINAHVASSSSSRSLSRRYQSDQLGRRSSACDRGSGSDSGSE